MGIGIRNNGSGTRVTIDGEKVIEKINFVEKQYLTTNTYETNTTLGASDNIAIINDTTFAHTHYYNNGYGFNYLYINNYDKNTATITETGIKQDTSHYAIASGYNNNMYQIKSHYVNSNSVYDLYEYKLNKNTEADNIITETKLLEQSQWMKNLVQHNSDTLYLYSLGSKMEITKFDKKKNEKTVILSIANDFYHGAPDYLFSYKDKLYLIASRKNEESKAQNVFEINLQNHTITELFNIVERFSITSNSIYSRLDIKKGKLIFYFIETYALKQAEWDIESNKFSEVVTLYKNDEYIQLLEIAIEETDYFKVCLATKGSELHKRIYSKTYLKEEI